MASKPSPPAGDDDRRIADAELLFKDNASDRPRPDAPLSPDAPPGDDYALEDRGEPVRKMVDPLPFLDEAPRARPAVTPAASAKPRTGDELEPDRRGRTPLEDSDAVEQIWSRGAEWGQTLAILAAVVVITGAVFAWLVSAGSYTLALVALLAGGVGFILCCYPIFISLERPVRITPEQAVKDFYGSLSHHSPHYRRMWLLLSTGGRKSGHFSTFPEFKEYWVDRLASLRAGRGGRFTPLKFEVGDFNSDKSQGKSTVDARYTVNVWIRGRQAEGPLATYRVETSLVKGQDRMWYLDRGYLPGDRI